MSVKLYCVSYEKSDIVHLHKLVDEIVLGSTYSKDQLSIIKAMYENRQTNHCDFIPGLDKYKKYNSYENILNYDSDIILAYEKKFTYKNIFTNNNNLDYDSDIILTYDQNQYNKFTTDGTKFKNNLDYDSDIILTYDQNQYNKFTADGTKFKNNLDYDSDIILTYDQNQYNKFTTDGTKFKNNLDYYNDIILTYDKSNRDWNMSY